MSRAFHLDRIRCDGYGMCAEIVPELIALDDWGFPILREGTVPDHLVELAQRAVDVCPVLALRLARADPLRSAARTPRLQRHSVST
jgi:ferredoxin